MPHQDLVIRFPFWPCMALVTLVFTQASLGPGYSIPHLELTLTRDLWSHSWPQTKLFTLVPPGPHPYLVTLVTPWASLGLVNLVLILSSLGSGDWSPPGPHLDSVNPVSTCASLDLVTVVPPGPHLDLVALVTIWGSPGPGSCGIHLASPGTQ